jgi:hypothetical protein
MQPVGVGSTRACAVALPSCGSARAKASGGKTHARWPAVWGRQPRRAAGGRTQHSCSTPSRSWRRCREHAGAACMCSTQTMAQQRRSGHVPAAASGLCRVSLAQRRHGCAGTGLWRREMRVGRRLGRQPSMEARARTTRLDLTTLRLRRELSSSHKRSFLPCKQLRGVAGPRDAGPEGGRRGRHPAVGRNAGMAALLAGAALMLRRAGAAVWRWESGTGAAAGGMRGRFLLPTARACSWRGWYNQLELARRFVCALLPDAGCCAPSVGVRTGANAECRRLLRARRQLALARGIGARLLLLSSFARSSCCHGDGCHACGSAAPPRGSRHAVGMALSSVRACCWACEESAASRSMYG